MALVRDYVGPQHALVRVPLSRCLQMSFIKSWCVRDASGLAPIPPYDVQRYF